MRRRQSDQGLRLVLADHGRQLLDYAERLGDEPTTAIYRAYVDALEAGRRVRVRASDVGLPADDGMVMLEPDGTVTA